MMKTTWPWSTWAKEWENNSESVTSSQLTTYDDDITHVNFVQDVGQFMMHVSYDDDDSEDYEEYEVKEYLLEDD